MLAFRTVTYCTENEETPRTALRKAVSKEFLDDEGLSLGADGEVLANGRMLYDPGYYGAIRKVLDE